MGFLKWYSVIALGLFLILSISYIFDKPDNIETYIDIVLLSPVFVYLCLTVFKSKKAA